MYEDLVESIRRRRVAFPPFGSGVSDAAIDGAEAELGMSLPPSYRWWLRNYGAGQIGGDIIYGIDEDGVGVPDVVQLHKADIADGLRPAHELVFAIGNEETFHFDISGRSQSGEYPIYYREEGQPDAHYARSFDDFLRKRIVDLLGKAG
jgi:hypothetical protein